MGWLVAFVLVAGWAGGPGASAAVFGVTALMSPEAGAASVQRFVSMPLAPKTTAEARFDAGRDATCVLGFRVPRAGLIDLPPPAC